MSVLTDLVVSGITLLPKPILRRLSSRYIAGERVEEALERIAAHNAEGYSCVLDILGEAAADQSAAAGEAHARAALAEYLHAADRLAASGHRAYVSAKPTHFGLRSSEDLCFELYDALARHCAGHGLFLRVEMEDHTTTDATLRVFQRLLTDHGNVGLVLQSRLFRTTEDVQALLASLPAGRNLDVRMVKGIYLEPAAIAHTEYQPIADAYVALARRLWEGGARVALATHDDVMAERLFALVRELGVSTERYELQVLMGVRRALWSTWRDAGHPVRVYVPFGPEWRAYSLRRLRKNPHLLRNMVLGTFQRA